MEAANVDLESVSFIDKESDKISDTVRLDDEESKTDVEESFEDINNGDMGDTDKSDEIKNVTNELVSTSKDIISLDSNISLDLSEKIVDNSVSNIEETETDQSANNDPEMLLTVSTEDENLLDEIHSGDFNATSSPIGKSSGYLNTSVQSVDDPYEVLEEEHDEEQDIEEEEEKDQTINDENNDADTIILDDDDDEDENDDGDVDDDSDDDDDDDHSDNSDNEDDESLDGTDKDENNDYDHKDDDISTLSSDDEEVEIVTKEPAKKPKITPRKKVKTAYKKLVKKSIKILSSSKPKRTMHLKSVNAITVATEHPNGNTETISTEKAKESEKMVVQMFSNESAEDDDDVCLIDDSPIKVNGKHETEDVKSVEQNIKVEQIKQEDNIENEIIVKADDVEMKEIDESLAMNGMERDSFPNKSQPSSMESIVSVAEQVPKITDSSSKETVPTAPIIVEKTAETVSNTKPNYKRSRSVSPADEVQPTKRLKTELEQTYIGHNKRVQEYIDKTSNNSVDEINNHVVSLLAEVQELHTMAAVKEQEWNNILYLKNVKEEIICRLTRRKSVMEITSAKVGEVEDYTILEQQPSISQKITKENRNSTNINHSANISQNAYLRNLSSTETAKLINNRAHMSTSDLDEERVSAAKMHRNILPKPELAGRSSPNINHLSSLASANSAMQHIQQQQQQKAQQQFIEQQQQIFQQTEHLNGHHQVGRQGAIKDVKSIIEAFRQKNPEQAPRRGRRKGCTSDGTVMSPRSTDGILTRQSVEGRVSELGLLLAKDRNSRPSSADSSPGNSNLASTNNNISTANANIAFNDMLMQYAKMNERPADLLTNASMMRQQQSSFPEVTLHPVSSQSNTTLHQSDSLQSNSLLHGILTKQNTRPSTTYNSFSPTLARLLTAPERITALPNNYRLPSSAPAQSKASGINLTKPRNEITITPVMSNSAIHQTILQQQLQRQQDSAARMKFPLLDDEADDSADRLVIDEGDIHNEQNATAGGREFPENEFPKCQGCKKHEAQFVCAGCENQWYCSRICQVSAWDEHCELCSG